MSQLQISTKIQVSKPLHEVFEAIIDPDKMRNYFIATSTGRMQTGKDLIWQFPEFDDNVPIKVLSVNAPDRILFEWDGAPGYKMKVEINLTEITGTATLVHITEVGMPNNEAGIKWLKGNTEGWANFLACLKAYAEHGINLRKGAFDFMRI
jgi:uncharacterized protein YndB with AHSA1/START domain